MKEEENLVHKFSYDIQRKKVKIRIDYEILKELILVGMVHAHSTITLDG